MRRRLWNLWKQWNKIYSHFSLWTNTRKMRWPSLNPIDKPILYSLNDASFYKFRFIRNNITILLMYLTVKLIEETILLTSTNNLFPNTTFLSIFIYFVLEIGLFSANVQNKDNYLLICNTITFIEHTELIKKNMFTVIKISNLIMPHDLVPRSHRKISYRL